MKKSPLHTEHSALVCQLLAAIHASNDLTDRSQHILTSYLIPDGIDQDTAVSQLLELLDGPEQRAVKFKVDTAIEAAMSYIKEQCQ